MLASAAINAFVMMAAAVALFAFGGASFQTASHVAFALGILPLILAAIAYFVPVLTRGAGGPRSIDAMAFCAWAGGVLIVAGLSGLIAFTAASYGAALLAGTAGLITLFWIRHRAKKTLGKPHPGLPWYVAALVFLVLAIVAVPLMLLWPEQRTALRLFHVHANLLGFVGLTAIGTLQVLLPTVLGRPDPEASRRLQRDLRFSVAGAALIAVGAAWSAPLALAGAACYLVAPLRMGGFWLARFAAEMRRKNSAGSALALSCLALVVLTAAGVLHAYHWLSGRDAVVAFVVAFLLPLVSGAATQLLPVWLRPGPQGEWHSRLRSALARFSGWRSLLLTAGGLAVAFGWPAGLWLAGFGLALVLAAFAGSLRYLR